MLTADKTKLILDNIKYAYYLINQWAAKQSEIKKDELDGIILEAFINAAILYDPYRQYRCSFINFAKMHVNQVVVKALQSKKRRANKMDIYLASAQLYDQDINNEYIDLHLAIKSLPQDQQAIIYDYYFHDLDLKGIAAKYNLSVSTVSLTLKAARESIKNKIE